MTCENMRPNLNINLTGFLIRSKFTDYIEVLMCDTVLTPGLLHFAIFFVIFCNFQKKYVY